MQDLFGSVRRSLVFRGSLAGDEDGAGSRLADKIGSCIRKSRVGLGLGLGFIPRLPSPAKDAPAVRWRKGELIGCGAFGHVYMGMNLDSGELLAVKQVLIGTSSASKDKAQAHVRELEEEVKLLKNLSHPNIVRYIGTAREDDTLNILMEFVPGGSISSLLGKFGSFPEAVIRMYTKQLLTGLDYLHENGIIHRDIKGANILVDNKGCIKLADFGASKQVAKLATMTAAKSMKGTPYWMAPEVILQTGHSFSADIWSVGCTVIEMATGKPPWSQQFQEVAALFHIGTTKSHPPIPEHLSHEAKDFLLKCLQKEPSSRPTSSDLLKHPFVSGEVQQAHHRSIVSGENAPPHSTVPSQSSLMTASSPAVDKDAKECDEFGGSSFWEMPCNNGDDDLCQFDDKDGFNIGSSFNPMAEPLDDWPCKFDVSPEPLSKVCEAVDVELPAVITSTAEKEQDDFTFPCGALCEDDDYEVTETKIRAFLDEKALELKKLQTPLYAFYNTLNAPSSSDSVVNTCDENISSNSKLPPKIKSSPSKRLSVLPFKADHPSTSPVNVSRRMSFFCGDPALKEIPSPRLNELTEHLPESHDEQQIISPSFSERRKKWKEELDQELERNREMMRQAAVGGRISSPKDNRGSTGQKRDRLRFGPPAK